MFFFFFQAEDGIRDTSVTGVQTCALPIYDTLDNPAAKFVLYREASHVAVRAGDIGVALEAAGALAQSFAVKPPEVQLGVLEAAEKARAASGRPIAEAALDRAEDAVRVDACDT